MSNMGKWQTVSVLLNLDGTLKGIFPNKAGRLIYEEYDPSVGDSSEKSKFYELKQGFVKNIDGGIEVLVNLTDKDYVSELKED